MSALVRPRAANCDSVHLGGGAAADRFHDALTMGRATLVGAVECADFNAPQVAARVGWQAVQLGTVGDPSSALVLAIDAKVGRLENGREIPGTPGGNGIRRRPILLATIVTPNGLRRTIAVIHAPPRRNPVKRRRYLKAVAAIRDDVDIVLGDFNARGILVRKTVGWFRMTTRSAKVMHLATRLPMGPGQWFDHGAQHTAIEADVDLAGFPAPAPDYVGPARHHGSRSNLPISRIVMHSTVGPTAAGSARRIANYFRTTSRKASAHYVVDAGEAVQVVYDNTIAYHAPPNTRSLGVEMCDNPTTSKRRWRNRDHRAMFARSARLVAQLCVAYDVPPWYRGVRALRAQRRGVTTHADVGKAFGMSTHWDPGAWHRYRFMRRVRLEVLRVRNNQNPLPFDQGPRP